MPDNSLEDRLNELEMKLVFQDDLLQSLNDIVIKQDKEIQDLWAANRLLKQSMNELKDNDHGLQDEAPPPHY